MSPSEKAARMVDLTRTACTLALAGLRARYPGADERELLLRLTALRLGAETTRRAYEWRAPDGLPDPLRVAVAVAGILDRLGVAYVTAGSFASSLHGEPRLTGIDSAGYAHILTA